ncbi:hypothetical protein [Flavobacterium sp.]|uniref:hypothetical protein n=1 Tax=Flavobacterium sp. TaxID=239 RepID=UPI00286B55AF|nr:hypothetical protein [Flavobacterium sp.]
MKNLEKQKKDFQGAFSTEIAITTFAIGTILFLLYYIFPNKSELLITGLFYIFFAVLVNGILLLILLYHYIILPNQREFIAIKIMILISNIPIATLYLYIIINLLNNELKF